MSVATQDGRRVASPAWSLFKHEMRQFWIGAVVLALLLVGLPWMLSPDGQTHGAWQQFLGRFHPLAVHLPIGLLLLLPVLEIGGRFRASLRDAAGFVLVLCVVCSVGAVVMGMMLAHGGGFAHQAVRGHMWAGITLTIGVMLCALIRPSWASGDLPFLYPVALFAVLLLTAWTGHQGGALTYGKTYLTEFAPAFVKQLGPHKTYPPVDPASVYATRVQPVLDSNCLNCHSGAKIKGGLQLDSYAHLMDGGSSGDVVISGHADTSLLLQRVTLPADHAKFMPQEGKPLAVKDIALIKSWVQQGASPSATHLAGIETKTAHTDDPLPQVGDYSALASQIRQVEKELGIRLDRFSAKPADGLVLRTIDAGRRFTDSDLQKLEPFAPYIVDAELGHTSVTDAGIATLAKMPHLRAIHLEDTAVVGRDLKPLGGLSQLRYLNLSSTKVTKESLDQLAFDKQLAHIYAFNTPAQPASAPNPVP